MTKMTQHEKWMKASKAIDELYGLFDQGLTVDECTDLGRSLRAIHKMMERFNKGK